MLKEENIIYEEFSNLFKENDNRLWFHRFRTQVLDPYFQLENGKEVLLKFIEIIKNDLNKDNLYTILKTKPSQFKTSFQEDYGFDSLPYENSPISISEFRNSNNNYDLISDYRFFKFYNHDNFENFYNFVDKNYEYLKNLDLYYYKKISLKDLKKTFNEQNIENNNFEFDR